MATKQKHSNLTQALLETADDMHRVGILSGAAHEKITMRHMGRHLGLRRDGAEECASPPITGDEIRSLRERAKLSQAVFARVLNLTVGYVSQLERGVKQPTGPALVLLDVIRRKGIEAIL